MAGTPTRIHRHNLNQGLLEFAQGFFPAVVCIRLSRSRVARSGAGVELSTRPWCEPTAVRACKWIRQHPANVSELCIHASHVLDAESFRLHAGRTSLLARRDGH
jgi:hypothetical protein